MLWICAGAKWGDVLGSAKRVVASTSHLLHFSYLSGVLHEAFPPSIVRCLEKGQPRLV